jgi:hypothetical protein
VSATDIGLQRDDLDSFNHLVPALLGLLKLLDDLTACLDEPAPATSAPLTDKDEPLASALLGLVSLHRTLRRWTDTAADATARVESRDDAGQTAERGLLR